VRPVIHWKRLIVLIVPIVVASGGLYLHLIGRERARLKGVPTVRYSPTPRPPRPWRWPTEPVWVVHDVTRHLASWAAFARGDDPAAIHVGVRRTDGDVATPGTFEVEVRAPGTPRTFVVRPRVHVWDPLAFAEVARAMIGGDNRVPEGEPAAGVEALLLAADTASLRKADGALWAEIEHRPRDPRLHAQAALVWASHALRESAMEEDAERPFLNGVTAHLALAAALRGGSASSPDARIAAAALDAVLLRQVEAAAALDALAAETAAPAWVAALRIRITNDPRLVTSSPGPSRLEKLEILRALRGARTCRDVVKQAHAWRMRPAVDWVVSTVGWCSEPEFSELSSRYTDLLATDTADLLDAKATNVDEALSLTARAVAENTHQPFLPSSVIPRYLRGDAGQRRLASIVGVGVLGVRRRGVPEEIELFGLATRSLVQQLPQRPLLEMVVEAASRGESRSYRPTLEICERLARLIADRPDLVWSNGWGMAERCKTQSLLLMVESDTWIRNFVTPGTGRLRVGPWRGGPVATGSALEEAHRHAPWDASVSSTLLDTGYRGDPPPAAVLTAYGSTLEYDLGALVGAVSDLHGADDDAVRFSERICGIDAELCCGYAGYVASLGRPEVAERMWKRALSASRDLITISNGLAGYVGLLLDRGDTTEALRVARRAADVYSHEGLRTLAYAYERLGRFDEAVREYAKIEQRYDSRGSENAFYVRYGYRYGGERFRDKADRAMAEVFPNGLQRRSLADFRREGQRGAVSLNGPNLTEGFRRLGLRAEDLLVAVDGFAVGSQAQFEAVLSFTDEQRISLVYLRRSRDFEEVAGPYVRTRYGPPGARR
jgi:tetratricopeptide (TPR) repeat protein